MSPLIVGHRGSAGTHPENTKASILAAANSKIDWVEVDVQMTKDGQLVITHDFTVDRCSNGHGRVDNHTFEELSKLDFGAWFGAHFQGEPILSFEELLTLAEQKNLGINLEIKTENQDIDNIELLVKTLLSKLADTSINNQQIVLSSFNHQVMRTLHQHSKGYKLGVISKRLSAKDWRLLEEISAFSCHLYYRWTSAQHIEKLHRAGYQVWCYTVNSPKHFKHWQKVDAIFSDFPQRFI